MLIAVTIVAIASLTTPGYDPITRTVSRLPAPGVDVAIGSSVSSVNSANR